MIEHFVRHPVAAHVVLLIMIGLGLWSVRTMPTSLDPKVHVPVAFVEIRWRGASAEDVEQLIAVPLEQALRTTPYLREMNSRSTPGAAFVWLEFDYDADMTLALDQVKQRVANVRNLPHDAEPPLINRDTDQEMVASLLVSGPGALSDLLPLVRKFERELLARGIDQIVFDGLPDQELAIQVSGRRLREMQLTLNELAAAIAERSSNVPAGTLGRSQGSRQLRSLDQQRDVAGFEQLYLRAGDQLIRLGNVAEVERRAADDQVEIKRRGQPTIEMLLLRHTENDAIHAADVMNQWLQDTRASLPPGVEITVYKEAWQLLGNQLTQLLRNGMSSLILVLLTLALFLNLRVAVWVAAGVPVAVFLGLSAFHHVFDGSINILSLIGVIMVLGIVVDDAIVVSEHTVSGFQAGQSPADAAIAGAKRMWTPVLASSMTTIAAFVPLLMIGGVMGEIVLTLPQMLLCVVTASLLECFIILPNHLSHSLARIQATTRSTGFRARFDGGLARWRDGPFRSAVARTLQAPGATLAAALVALLLAGTLIASQRVGLNLVTGLDLESVTANIEFAASATTEQKQTFIEQLEGTMLKTDQDNGGGSLTGHTTRDNSAYLNRERQRGAQYASIDALFAFAENRKISPQQFIQQWRASVDAPDYVEQLVIEVEGGANGGEPALNFILRGRDINNLKAAAESLSATLAQIEGVNNVRDDLPYGREQIIFELNESGRASGLTSESLGAQLRAAFSGQRVQIFNDREAELEVRVVLTDAERDSLAALKQFPVRASSGAMVPVDAVANLYNRRGIDVIRHSQGESAVRVSAQVDTEANNAYRITEMIQDEVMPKLVSRYDVAYGLGGQSRSDALMLETLGAGALLTLVLIYVILVWTFASYVWPLAIMAVIPFGLTGVIFGHWVMGMDIGAMSLLAVFALSGVVVNDSIVLITAFQEQLRAGKSAMQAVLEAATLRFRAVILTSITTIVGLLPLIFEQTTLAIYIAPIAVTISFGLAFATVLVLFVVPAMLLLIDRSRQRVLDLFAALRKRAAPLMGTPP